MPANCCAFNRVRRERRTCRHRSSLMETQCGTTTSKFSTFAARDARRHRGRRRLCGLVAGTRRASEIKIGFQAPLTGFAATDGKSAKIAAEMAIEEINAAGGEIGQKLQLISYDDQAKSDQAIFTANKLIGEDGVKLVVNASYSASGRAAAPVFQNAGVVMISAYGVHPDITTRRRSTCSGWSISDRRRGAPPRCSSARTSS